MAARAHTKFNVYIVNKCNISVLTVHPGKMVLVKTIVLFTCIAILVVCMSIMRQ